jgi:crossover junction endodeoxyribonuclease RuvC
VRILGIDPGLQRTGFGIVDASGSRLSYVASGVIRTDASGTLAQRIFTIADGVREVVAQAAPDCAVVEIVFVNVNPQSTLLLGQARGAALAALVTAGLEVHEYTALQVKKSTVGAGHANKHQVQDMVMRLLSLPAAPQADAADALACAITHAHAGAHLARLRNAGAPTATAGKMPAALRSRLRSTRKGRLI